MKKILLSLNLVLLATSLAHGAVTVTAARVEGFQTAGGGDLQGGVLGIFVLDAGGDGFSAILEGSTIGIDTIFSDGNDIVLNIVSSVAGDDFGNAFISGVGGTTLSIELGGNINTGDQYAVYWFPTLTTSDLVFTANDTYGIATAANWILPSDGSSTPSPSTVFSAGPANLVVLAIPEPTSSVLVCLGVFGLLARRRRD